VAHPDKQVVLLHGDGAFGFNAMEYEVMLRYKIPVVTVMCNDEYWGMTSHHQRHLGEDRLIGTHIGFVRYDKMIQGLGGYGELVEKPEDIRPAIKRAFESGLPALVNIHCASIPRAGWRDPESRAARIKPKS